MDSRKTPSESEIIAQITTLLDNLPHEGPREATWRTTDQLTNELVRRGFEVDLDDVDQALTRHEARYRKQLEDGLPAEAYIRRATYPDRRTALALWGSTNVHRAPWPSQPASERLDSPQTLTSATHVDESAPRAFLSHTHNDAVLATAMVSALANMQIGAWMFESDIEYRRPIAKCVRAAIEQCACCVGLLTRTSIASLWVLTELDTALECKKPVLLVIDVADELLLHLLASVRFQNPKGPFDFGVQYCQEVVDKLHADYCLRESESRANRYLGQVRDFLASLPTYLAGRCALGFPCAPPTWSGSFAVQGIETLMDQVQQRGSKNLSAASPE